MIGLAAFVVGVGVVSWLVSGVFGRHNATAKDPSSTARTSPSPFPTVPDAGQLQGVTCVSAGDCWAVGYTARQTAGSSGIVEEGFARPLIEHYQVSHWDIVGTPSPTAGQLRGVTCVSAADCWAVGSDDIAGASLIEHYTGTWAVVANADARAGELTSVACASAQDCWAVGQDTTGGGPTPLIEHYAGTGWAISVDAGAGELLGVTCVNAQDCWAIGASSVDSAPLLIEHYEGSRWALTPNPGAGDLSGVTCATARDCWAVGYVRNVTGIAQRVIGHYTGRTWAISANSGEGKLSGVTCVNGEDCWAVGYVRNVNGGDRLSEHYTGGSWAIENTPDPVVSVLGELGGELNAVACVGASECWGVGDVGVSSRGTQVLIEQYLGSNWALIKAPNVNQSR